MIFGGLLVFRVTPAPQAVALLVAVAYVAAVTLAVYLFDERRAPRR